MSYAVEESIAPIEPELAPLRIPGSRAELISLLERYGDLKHRINLQNKLVALEMGTPDLKLQNEVQRMEKTLRKVARRQQKFKQAEAELSLHFDAILSKNGPANLDLLETQIVGLQLLLKDVDLPELLQRELDNAAVLQQQYGQKNHELPAKFELRVEALGLADVQMKTAYDDPLAAPFGHLLGEQSISLKIQNRMTELEDLPANLGSFDTATVTGIQDY